MKNEYFFYVNQNKLMNRWIDVYKIFDTKKILRTTGGIFNFKSKDSSFHQCVMSDSLFVHVDIDAVFRNLISVKNPWLNCYGKSFTSVQQLFRDKTEIIFSEFKIKKENEQHPRNNYLLSKNNCKEYQTNWI